MNKLRLSHLVPAEDVMKKLYLTLQDLLQVMRDRRIEVVLDTDIEQLPPLSGRCHIQLVIAGGEPVTCTITNEHSTFSGPDALVILFARKDMFEWTLAPSQSPAPLVSLMQAPVKASADILLSSVPKRIRPIEESIYHAWGRPQRSIYNLIDGVKTIQDILCIVPHLQQKVALQFLSSLVNTGDILLIDSSGKQVNAAQNGQSALR